jgi:hypothetical protein
MAGKAPNVRLSTENQELITNNRQMLTYLWFVAPPPSMNPEPFIRIFNYY